MASEKRIRNVQRVCSGFRVLGKAFAAGKGAPGMSKPMKAGRWREGALYTGRSKARGSTKQMPLTRLKWQVTNVARARGQSRQEDSDRHGERDKAELLGVVVARLANA